ncbi:MAG: 50S ribosomal protein L13 [Bacteroidales bacterium]|nr:50S ribosomal protein L13 [Bacteroidales bacterium]MBQ7984360.1 50S ribosomal protein L13 [Bacteroidales bacterium]
MSTLSYRTQTLKKGSIEKKWIVVDAENQVVGRMATKVANVLRGKHKPSFSPNMDCGDNVIIINAEKVRFTGKKYSDKQYVRHTGYPGGQRFSNPQLLMEKFPERILEHAIKGMLPKNKLGAQLYRNLKIVVGPDYSKYNGVKPEVVNLDTIR